METFKPRFKEDREWVFILLLPLGLLCLILPIFIFVAIQSKDNVNTLGNIFLAGGFLGIPAYFIGIIPVFLFTNGCLSSVSFTEDEIIIKMPKVLFPFFLFRKTIKYDQIIDVMSIKMKNDRYQFQLRYSKGKRVCSTYLPMIKNDEYTKKILSLKHTQDVPLKGSEEAEKKEKLLSIINPPEKTLYSKISKIIIDILVIILIFGSGWVGTTIEGVDKADGFNAGMNIALLSCLLCIVGWIPVVGQVLLYFYGKQIILFVMNLFGIPNVEWSIKYFGGINSDFLNLVFWPIFIFSILISIGRIQTWGRNKRVKKVLEGEKKENI